MKHDCRFPFTVVVVVVVAKYLYFAILTIYYVCEFFVIAIARQKAFKIISLNIN